ncbi:MAG TPA: flagellar filament outer layer protein FlaA, partial [Spirochaetota bacterium]|nr:flagellar filament outer layer protein FlaA [Spirochaetota bacterium]
IAGRNYKHWLRFIIQDFFGNERLLYVDRLNFIGWKELLVSIPEVVRQRDFHFVDKIGIKFNGFLIECDPIETYGDYYLYFDELRAFTDIFNEKTRDVDDMHDDW